MTDTAYIYENYSGSEIVAMENYRDLAREFTGENPHPDDDLVLPGFGCPKCHERRPDYLLIGDGGGDGVTCQSCGHVYGLPVGLYDNDEGDDWYDRYALGHPGALM